MNKPKVIRRRSTATLTAPLDGAGATPAASAAEAAAPPPPGLHDEFAAQLTETGAEALEQLRNAVEVCGAEAVRTVVNETLAVEQQGGMTTADGQRRRTPGGVFFHLLRQRVSREEWARIRPAARGTGLPVRLVWSERSRAVNEALARPGSAVAEARAKTLLTRVRPRTDHVAVLLEAPVNVAALPRALPRPDETPQLACLVCVAEWQWMRQGDRVRKSVELVADGPCHINEARDQVIVLAREIALEHARPEEHHAGVEVTLTGRAGAVVTVGNCAVTVIVGERQRAPQRGLPDMPRTPTTFVVYMPAAAWQGLHAAPEDKLVFHGRVFVDRELGCLAVLARSIERAPPA